MHGHCTDDIVAVGSIHANSRVAEKTEFDILDPENALPVGYRTGVRLQKLKPRAGHDFTVNFTNKRTVQIRWEFWNVRGFFLNSKRSPLMSGITLPILSSFSGGRMPQGWNSCNYEWICHVSCVRRYSVLATVSRCSVTIPWGKSMKTYGKIPDSVTISGICMDFVSISGICMISANIWWSEWIWLWIYGFSLKTCPKYCFRGKKIYFHHKNTFACVCNVLGHERRHSEPKSAGFSMRTQKT